jgi:hypothetical protein
MERRCEGLEVRQRKKLRIADEEPCRGFEPGDDRSLPAFQLGRVVGDLDGSAVGDVLVEGQVVRRVLIGEASRAFGEAGVGRRRPPIAEPAFSADR